MSCCEAPAWAHQFDRRTALRDLRDFRKHGPAATTKALVDALLRAGVEQSTLLDIGGGVGAIQLALLRAGAREAIDVDVSAPYLEVAREEAARQAVGERIRFQLGDFVDLAPEIPAVDVVTLDRVVCCYAQLESLVRLSAERARRLYGLVYPRDRWLMRTVVRIENLFRRLWRNPFRSYVHSVDAMDVLIRSLGFTRRYQVRTFGWEVAVYERGPHSKEWAQ